MGPKRNANSKTVRFYLFVTAGIFGSFAFLGALTLLGGKTVSAQRSIEILEPAGGGEFTAMLKDEMSDEQRNAIKDHIRTNIEKLEGEGKLAPASPEAVPLSWPVAKAPGVVDFNVDGISNFVDQNLMFPNQLLDYNCGARTYDQASGYNHGGIDIFSWPFSWKKMDNNEVEVIAAAPGTIVLKSDGNFDRQCGFGSGNWNAIYIRHSDNSVAWYGHMKSGSLNPKIVGNTVVAGERLGVVGSSGNSTGPHLHFELYNAANQLQDPYHGACNTLNNFSWWAVQPAYRVTQVNRLMTASAGPVFPTCPTTETTNEKTTFRGGDLLVTAAYYRDQIAGQQTQYSILRPDGSVFQSWVHSSASTFNASWWWWSRTLPTNVPGGVWKFRAVFNGQTYDQPFAVQGTTPFDFDGDRKTDVSIFRPAVEQWWISRSSDNTVAAASFGAANDPVVPVPSDFTGDGKTDIASWGAVGGQWYVLRSEDSTYFAFPFGSQADIPAPADFDGDGKSDPAVFRPSTGTWYIRRSSDAGTTIQQFGTNSDLPVPVDFDGDARADLAIFRPNGPNGAEWWYLRSGNGLVAALQFGSATDRAVPADYTGDGKSDVAIWRPSDGFWYVLRSEDFSYYAFPFGTQGDTPSPGDYDGDGKADTAVFRPSTSIWYANRSTAGILIQQFGSTGDVPLPSVFTR